MSNKLVKAIKNPRLVFKKIRSFFLDFRTNHYLKNSVHLKNDLHIVFICQCESIFSKCESLFLELVNRNIKTTLYVVQDDNSSLPYKKKKLDNHQTIFEKKYPKYVVKYENKSLKDIKPSLVIYTRPYDYYLPKEIRSYNVLKYAKTASMTYHYSLTDVYHFYHDIFKSSSIFIADREYAKEYFDKRRQKYVTKGFQKSIYAGFPGFDNIYQGNNESFFDEGEKRFNVIWTPRWSTDAELGGSSFFDLYKDLFDLMINNDDYKFIFRPHPLLFSNFVKSKRLTKEEADEIIRRFKDSNNALYDSGADYFANFKKSDVLISDFSSIVPEYFLSGHPFIYFLKDNNYEILSSELKKMVDCNYVARNFEEVKECLSLIRNQDPKKEARMSYLKEFSSNNSNSSKRIVDALLKEFS